MATCALCSLPLDSSLLVLSVLLHAPLAALRQSPPFLGGAKVLELEFKCGKDFPKEAT